MSATDLGDWAASTKAAAMVKLYKIIFYNIGQNFIYTDILNILKFLFFYQNKNYLIDSHTVYPFNYHRLISGNWNFQFLRHAYFFENLKFPSIIVNSIKINYFLSLVISFSFDIWLKHIEAFL